MSPQETLAALRKWRDTLNRLIDSATKDTDEEGDYECPLCNGEGHVPAETVQQSVVLSGFTEDKLGCFDTLGIQTFGIGQAPFEVAELLRAIIAHYESFMQGQEQMKEVLQSLDDYAFIKDSAGEARFRKEQIDTMDTQELKDQLNDCWRTLHRIIQLPPVRSGSPP